MVIPYTWYIRMCSIYYKCICVKIFHFSREIQFKPLIPFVVLSIVFIRKFIGKLKNEQEIKRIFFALLFFAVIYGVSVAVCNFRVKMFQFP